MIRVIDHDVRTLDARFVSDAFGYTSNALHRIILALEKIETKLFIAEGK